MLLLRDDTVLEIFEDAAKPPGWIEVIDIQNEEYEFCDEHGQRYVGVVTGSSGWSGTAQFVLRPEAAPQLGNVIDLVDRAQAIEPNKYFGDLDALRRHLTAPPSK